VIDHRFRARVGFASVCVVCAYVSVRVHMCVRAHARVCRNSMRAYIEKSVVEVAHKRPMQ
jgi:hypothetical protein